MTRIEHHFIAAKKQALTLHIPFITAGFPTKAATLPILHRMAAANSYIIEIGIPFSDPSADGPVIEAAGHRALANGVNLEWIFETVSAFRTTNTKTAIVLMGYLNPIESFGIEAFAARAKAVGIDGVLIVDAPLEESHDIQSIFKNHELDFIYLIAPTTSEVRLKAIVNKASGYIYTVSLKGVTGSTALEIDTVEQQIARIRQHTPLPIAVGFGIRTPETAVTIGQFADSIIIGSRIIELIHESLPKSLDEMPIDHWDETHIHQLTENVGRFLDTLNQALSNKNNKSQYPLPPS